MSEATVIGIQLHHARGEPLTPVGAAQALVQRGLQGDSHARRPAGGRRQVVILDESTMAAFGLRPGDLREQITVRGLPDISMLPKGTQVAIGDVIFEAAGDCEPCTTIGDYLGVEDPQAFREALEGRRGLLCRVAAIEGEGWVRVGDPVRVLVATSH